MSKKAKSYDKSFKARVALEAYRGEKSVLEIASDYKIPKTNVQNWLKKLEENAFNLYELPQENIRKANLHNLEIDKLHKIIGEITVENNFLKKRLAK